MWAFLVEHIVEIIFGLIAAGALAFCKYLHSQSKNYKAMLKKQELKELNDSIDERIENVKSEIEELRTYIRNVGQVEQSHMNLIISSYKFRLVQLCREFIHQGYMTQKQYDQLVEFYKLYVGLGGNGQAKEYYEKAIVLEIKDVE